MSTKRTTKRINPLVDNVSTSSTNKRSKLNNNVFEEIITSDIPDHTEYRVKLNPGQRCDATKLTPNSLIYRPARIVVLSTNDSTNVVSVRNQDLYKDRASGADWSLDSNLVSSQCWSADQYTQIEKVTMSTLASKLKEEVGDCICKVEFYKQPEAKEMAQLIKECSQIIEESDGTEAIKDQMYKKLFDRTQIGDYRVMRGYIARADDQDAQENETGMLKFIDAEAMAEGKYATRLINLRNIQALTFKLTRYELK
jgi:hypothetical protein